jgi:hypothetical protein
MSEQPEEHIILIPPKGTSFQACSACGMPFLDDGTSVNCIWCDLNLDDL